jgi:hypothetical protein
VIRFLKIARAVGRLLLVLGGAFLVVTGLSSTPKMFAGIGLIVLGILYNVVLTALLRRQEPESRAALLPGSRPDANFLARFFATFWRASFLDELLVLGFNLQPAAPAVSWPRAGRGPGAHPSQGRRR